MRIKTNIIYNEDCIEGIKRLPDKSIDLVITDPPYGIGYKRDYKKDKNIMLGDTGLETIFFLDDILLELKRILKDGTAIYWFTRFDIYPYLFIKFSRYFRVKNQIIWYKGTEITGLGDLPGNYCNNYESILFAIKGRHILRGKRCGSVWNVKPCKKIFHLTQKPIEIIDKIIRYSSNENDIILDPFMGSGTTAIACKRLNRHYIGFEISKEYCKIAEQRLEAEINENRTYS